jgi:hypothetical protein
MHSNRKGRSTGSQTPRHLTVAGGTDTLLASVEALMRASGQFTGPLSANCEGLDRK